MAVNALDHFDGDQLHRDVRLYHAFGNHRTGLAAEAAVTDWMEREFEEAGLAVGFQPWKVDVFLLEGCGVEAGGEKAEAFPIWFPKATGVEGVSGKVAVYEAGASEGAGEGGGEGGYAGKIVYVGSDYLGKFDWHKDLYQALVDELAEAGALGIVFAAPHVSGRIFAQNAQGQYRESPQRVPAVVIGTRDEEAMRRAANEGGEVTVRIEGERHRQAKTLNTIGQIERGERYVIVSTPLTAWFGCAGERGAGVALFLALAKWAAAQKTDHSFLFVGTTGHELDNLGAMHLHDAGLLPGPEAVDCWLHLGASIANCVWEYDEEAGAYRPGEALDAVELVATEELLGDVKEAFAGTGYEARTGAALGELGELFERGYAGFGLFGRAHHFHTDGDVPEGTTGKLLKEVGVACAGAIGRVVR